MSFDPASLLIDIYLEERNSQASKVVKISMSRVVSGDYL